MPMIAKWVIGTAAAWLFAGKAGDALGEEVGKAVPWIIGGLAVLVVMKEAK